MGFADQKNEDLVPYELERLANIERNQARLLALNLPAAAQALGSDPHGPKSRPPRQKHARGRVAPEELRKSGRARKQVDYTDPGFRISHAQSPKRSKRSHRREATSATWDGELLSTAARQAAMAAAEAANEGLQDCVVKVMSGSHVSGGFWLQVPAELCEHFQHVKHDIVLLCDQHPAHPQHHRDTGIWDVGWLPKTNKEGVYTGGVGLSRNWRGFALDQALTPNDSIVMEAIKAGAAQYATTMRIHIFRGRDYVTTADKKNQKDHQAESSDAAMGGDSTGDEGEGSKDAGSADGPTSASGRPTGQQDAGSEHASPAAAPPTALPATEAAGPGRSWGSQHHERQDQRRPPWAQEAGDASH
ncbi:hypothetical protein WJX84_005205 [Apatococcus fuscideae]|uniref:TF-B3 domain-containing protein n=1 Tax=Apatococcus fuscideae TaxID=2026836 RepID=A0AAW1STB4_9CHLO